MPSDTSKEVVPCRSVTRFGALPFLRSYYNDIVSIMAGTVTMLPAVLTQDADATKSSNYVINQHSTTSTQIWTSLLVNMFEPVTEVTEIYLAYGDPEIPTNLTLTRTNGTFARQEHPQFCSSSNLHCVSYPDADLLKATRVSKSQGPLRTKWKMFCDRLSPDTVTNARILMYFAAAEAPASAADVASNEDSLKTKR